MIQKIDQLPPTGKRLVRTEPIGPDPIVFASVADTTKFSPLPPDQVPVVEGIPNETMPLVEKEQHSSAPEAARSEKSRRPRLMRRHREETKHTHRRERKRAHEPERKLGGARTHDPTYAPDVGGTQMTAEQLRRDGSKDPLVKALSSVFGPK